MSSSWPGATPSAAEGSARVFSSAPADLQRLRPSQVTHARDLETRVTVLQADKDALEAQIAQLDAAGRRKQLAAAKERESYAKRDA